MAITSIGKRSSKDRGGPQRHPYVLGQSAVYRVHLHHQGNHRYCEPGICSGAQPAEDPYFRVTDARLAFTQLLERNHELQYEKKELSNPAL